jgi:TRAP-type C4-dicarboxylate transport system permease large subunit
VGLNVYVVNNLARDVPMSETYKGLAPFLVWDIIRMGVLLMAPTLSLWMVAQLFTR